MRLRASLAGGLALALALFTGCGAGDDPATSSGSGNGPEKTTIQLGTMPVVDTAPIQIALDKGLFKAEGLDVRPSMLAGGAEAIPKLKSGALDISVGNYVSFLKAHSQRALDLRIVADGFQSAPGSHVIMVPKDSAIKSPADLAGKTIAVNTKGNVATLLVRVAAKAQGVDLDEDRNFVEFPFPEMENALKGGKVDAAQVVEPFGTFVGRNLDARVIWDTSRGSTANFPIAGYAATAEFTKANPKTVAAFQRAMSKAAKLAGERANVVKAIPEYTKIPADVAKSLAIGKFPTTLQASRLQRVADSMKEYGLLDAPLDVQDLIVAGK